MSVVITTQDDSISVLKSKVIVNDTDDSKDDFKDDLQNPVVSVDDQSQNKSDTPLPPLTFNFVGIRPTDSHIKNHQTSSILLDTISVKITLLLTVNDTVHKLKELILSEFEIPKERSLLIMYGNIRLNKNDELLKDYGITNESWLLLAIYDNILTEHNDIYTEYGNDEEITSRQHREQNRRQRDMDYVKRRLQRIQDLKNGIKPKVEKLVENKKTIYIQKTDNSLKNNLKNLKNIDIIKGLDIITMEKNVNCMKLPICGHLLSKNSLSQYILSQFSDRQQIIKCPHTNSNNNNLCSQEWEYPLIKQYLLLNDNDNNKEKEKKYLELGKLELLAARNVIEMKYDLQKCIKCQSLLYRNLKDNNFNVRVECPLCPTIKSIFCWGCNSKWSDSHKCDITFKASTMEILSKCDVKKIGSVQKVPSIRACPKCNQLINHLSACKHIKCTFCKTNFCFICLKPQKNYKWQCGDYDDPCSIHKRQNYELLPKLNQTSFQCFN